MQRLIQRSALAWVVAVWSIALAHTAFGRSNPAGHHPIGHLGLWVQVERRGWASGYGQGALIQNFDQYDSVVGSLVSNEASLQFDKMKAMGVNTFTYELRTADPGTAPRCGATKLPDCSVCYVLGLDWPQPTPQELTSLKSFFDLIASKGMKVDMLLTTTHMEESPSTNSKAWLGSIFDTIQGHPALDVILLGGDAHTLDFDGDGVPDQCGGQGGEPALWLGPNCYAATYLEWVIPFANSHGIPTSQISAEAIVGDFRTENQAPAGNYCGAGSGSTGGHLWDPLQTLKTVFTKLKVPASQQTYALSFYEHRKCIETNGLPCTDLDPHDWADETLKRVASIVGTKHTLMTAGGTGDPPNWPAQFAFESLGVLFQKYGIGRANFWRWAGFNNSEDTDPTVARAVKVRGVDFVYFPPEKEIVDLAGFHLSSIPNGSFEKGGIGKPPSQWTVSGDGTGIKYFLAGESNEPQVPSRGQYDLRLTTSANANAVIAASSKLITIAGSTAYTTTGNLRFGWSGDPNPSGDPTLRPQVFVIFKYFQTSKIPSSVKAQDIFRFFQENSTTDFQTFPLQYTTPSDAVLLQIVIGAARYGLPSPIMFDTDNLR